MKIPKRICAAMKRYYHNRSRQKTVPWDKQADLNNLFSILEGFDGFSNIQACAGMFWITWRCGVQTTHSEKNYWRGKVLARRKDGEWVFVRRTRNG